MKHRMQTLPTPASSLLLKPLSRLCVAVSASTPAALEHKAADLLDDFPFVELRLDSLPAPAAAIPVVTRLIEAHPGATLLATCRRRVAGGQFGGSPQDELALLQAAARAGCRIVDLAIESADELPSHAIESLRSAGAAVVLSFHDFEATGSLERLAAVRDRILRLGPDVLKIVPTALCLADNLTLLGLLEQTAQTGGPPVAAMSMGEQGIPSRLLNLRAGSAFTFAAATAEEATAPGQFAARTLRDTFHVESIGRSTRIYGVAGDPIRSSLSPLIHNLAFRTAGVDAVYLPLRTADARDLFTLARELPLDGLSITMPLKQAIIPLLDGIDPLAAQIGAVNTVLRRSDGTFHGFNTDVAGILTPIERRLSLRGSHVLVLGAGGAARAAVFACRSKGARVSILNRTPATAAALADEAGAHTISRGDVAGAHFDVVINATPAGMKTSAAALPLGPEDLTAQLVFDLVYNPIDTPLLQMARARGILTIPGTEMFVLQGARQFELWTGGPAPEEAMRNAVLEALTLPPGV